MSDTPRTDAVSNDDTITYSEGVPIEFARALERENGRLRTLHSEQADKLRELECALSEERTLVSNLQGGIVEQTVRADEAEAARERQRQLKMEAHARASELRIELADAEAALCDQRAYAELATEALTELLRQVEAFVAENGEADFYTGQAKEVLAKNPFDPLRHETGRKVKT